MEAIVAVAKCQDTLLTTNTGSSVMELYQTWLGEGPELAILPMLGLLDRPADNTA